MVPVETAFGWCQWRLDIPWDWSDSCILRNAQCGLLRRLCNKCPCFSNRNIQRIRKSIGNKDFRDGTRFCINIYAEWICIYKIGARRQMPWRAAKCFFKKRLDFFDKTLYIMRAFMLKVFFNP